MADLDAVNKPENDDPSMVEPIELSAAQQRLSLPLFTQLQTFWRPTLNAAMGQQLPHAPQPRPPAFSPSCHREVGHRPAGWGVLSFAMFQCA